MGVLTTGYSIPPKLMRKIRANHDDLGFILEISEEENPDWKVEDYEFDKSFEEIIRLLRNAGYQKTYQKLDCESYFYSDNKNYLDYEGYDIWVIPPSGVKIIVKELEKATFEELKTKGLANQMTDYRGGLIHESMYRYYVGDIEKIKKFFRKIAEQGNYLLLAAA